ncbi:uncharacterized [Tachysurus ichikawai]
MRIEEGDYGMRLNKNHKKSGKTLTSGVDTSTEDSVTQTEHFIISTTLGGGQCDKNRFKETPVSNSLSSFTAFCSFQAGGGNNYQKRTWRLITLIYSDVASLVKGEVSMSGRSAWGKQTVNKIFSVLLYYHRSNATEKLAEFRVVTFSE